jgi:hypothetical protein
MTRAKMMEIALAMAKVSGNPYVTVAADQNAVANRRMLMFAEKTRCIFRDAITFDLSPSGSIPSDGLYDLRDSTNTFNKKICQLSYLLVNGVPLLDLKGDIGLVPLPMLKEQYRGYQTVAAGPPKHACMVSPAKLRLFPVPDQSYTNNFAAGYVLPADIDTGSGGDNTQLEFNEEDCEAVACFVGVGLVYWTSATQTDFERMTILSREAASHMGKLMIESEAQMDANMTRGATQGEGWACLG